MTFITKQQAEEYLREYHNDNYVEDGETETFEEMIEILSDTLDMLSPNAVYAFQVYTEAA